VLRGEGTAKDGSWGRGGGFCNWGSHGDDENAAAIRHEVSEW
jgi:hypothetical protein